MPGNPFYMGSFWKGLRQQALARAGHKCEVPGCKAKAEIVDHIEARPQWAKYKTEFDRLGNLRCLCRGHDNQVKEKKNGERKSGGVFRVGGTTVEGFPLDPGHPWATEGKDDLGLDLEEEDGNSTDDIAS